MNKFILSCRRAVVSCQSSVVGCHWSVIGGLLYARVTGPPSPSEVCPCEIGDSKNEKQDIGDEEEPLLEALVQAGPPG